jgi:hypothetical protein
MIDRTAFVVAIRDAINSAHTERQSVLDTRDVLVALMRIDNTGHWDRIRLHFGDEDELRARLVADPEPEPVLVWGDIWVTTTCKAALDTAQRLATAYDQLQTSVGLVTIGLVSNPAGAAAQALLNADPTHHDQLLDAIQDAVVGGTLDGLADALGPQVLQRPAGTRTVIDVLGGTAMLAHRDALAVLRAAVATEQDEKLRQRYERMLLEPAAIDAIRPDVVGLPGPSAAQLVDRARSRFDTDQPDTRQLAVVAVDPPSELVGKALWLLGVPVRELAFAAAEADATANRIGQRVSEGTAAVTVVTAVLSLATTVFIARAVVIAGLPVLGIVLGLVLIYLAWHGHWAGNLLVVAVMPWWAGLAATAVAVAAAAVDHLLTVSERHNALDRTGMALTWAQWRRHIRLGSATQARPVTGIIKARRLRRAGADR